MHSFRIRRATVLKLTLSIRPALPVLASRAVVKARAGPIASTPQMGCLALQVMSHIPHAVVSTHLSLLTLLVTGFISLMRPEAHCLILPGSVQSIGSPGLSQGLVMPG